MTEACNMIMRIAEVFIFTKFRWEFRGVVYFKLCVALAAQKRTCDLSKSSFAVAHSWTTCSFESNDRKCTRSSSCFFFFFFCLIVHLIRFFLSLQTWMRSIRLQVQEIHLNWQITEVNFNCRDKLLRYWAISPQLITTTRASFQKANLKEKPLFISRYWSFFPWCVFELWAWG